MATEIFVFFLLASFKTFLEDHLLLSLREREKERKKAKKRKRRGEEV